MSEQSSPTSQTASAFYDPDSSSWRTCQGSLLSEAPPSLQHLPPCATTVDGWLYEQATPEHLTAVRDGSALLGTPTTATSGRSPEHGRGRAPNPQELAALLPTPRTSDTNGPGVHGDGGLDLRTAAALLPTPVVNDMGRGKTPDEWDSWTDEMKERHGNGNGHGASLAIEAARLLPTPRAQNGEPRNMKPWIRPLDQPQNLENAIARLLPTPTVQDGANNAGPSQWERNSKPLNVVAVELTMGLTGTLSSDGNGSSDDQHPTQPMIEDSDPSSSNG